MLSHLDQPWLWCSLVDLFASWIFSDLLLFFPGLFAAAHDLKIEWVIVKGISHFADGNNPAEKSWESHACIMAASLVSNMLKDPFVFEQWPHYEGRCHAPLWNHVIIKSLPVYRKSVFLVKYWGWLKILTFKPC